MQAEKAPGQARRQEKQAGSSPAGTGSSSKCCSCCPSCPGCSCICPMATMADAAGPAGGSPSHVAPPCLLPRSRWPATPMGLAPPDHGAACGAAQAAKATQAPARTGVYTFLIFCNPTPFHMFAGYVFVALQDQWPLAVLQLVLVQKEEGGHHSIQTPLYRN